MKFSYVANTYMPTGKTHGIQIMEMCQALSNLGVEVELVVRDLEHVSIKDDPFEFYDVSRNFVIKKLWCLNLTSFGKIGFLVESLTFAISAFFYSFGKDCFFYSRDEIVVLALRASRKNVTWEAHMGYKNILIRMVIAFRVKIVVITEALRGLYVSLGMPSEKILVAPDGADVDRFDIAISKEEARKQLGLPQDKKILLYKGSIGKWKGTETMAASAPFIKTKNVVLAFIGGNPEDVISFKKEFSGVGGLLILGKVHRKLTPIYQKAADALVIPNSAKEDISKLYTSPMKLFGYMAGGRPIIASNLPSLREILKESSAHFFEPDNPKSLASTVDEVFGHYNEALVKAGEALEDVRKYSWSKRAQGIIDFIQK